MTTHDYELSYKQKLKDKKLQEMKYLTLYYDDFDNINYWYDICDQLELPHNTMVIDIELSRIKYDNLTETNIIKQVN